ncbi:MAG: phage holin family protein [Candidatus Gracilibacteria bacterium]
MSLILKIIFGIAVNALALYSLTVVTPEVLVSGGVKFFLVGGVVLGAANVFIKPVIKILSLPLIFLTGGLFLIVINALMLWFLSYFLQVAQFQDLAISFPTFGSYVIGSLVFGLINWLVGLILK